jgi:hypothetical protein
MNRPAVNQCRPRAPDAELLSSVTLSAEVTGGVAGGSGVIASGMTVTIRLSLMLPPSPLQLML